MKVVINKKAKRRIVWLYVLNDPRTGKPHYGGQTYQSPRARLASHCLPKRPGDLRPVDQWIAELAKDGLKPEMQIVARVVSFSGDCSVDCKIANGAEFGLIKQLNQSVHWKAFNLNVAGTSRDPMRVAARKRKQATNAKDLWSAEAR